MNSSLMGFTLLMDIKNLYFEILLKDINQLTNLSVFYFFVTFFTSSYLFNALFIISSFLLTHSGQSTTSFSSKCLLIGAICALHFLEMAYIYFLDDLWQIVASINFSGSWKLIIYFLHNATTLYFILLCWKHKQVYLSSTLINIMLKGWCDVKV